MVLIVVVTVVLLISIDRVSGLHTTDGRRRTTVDDGILSRFLHRRRPKPWHHTSLARSERRRYVAPAL